MFNVAGQNSQSIIQQLQLNLMQIRDANTTAAQYLHDFGLEISLADLTAPLPDGPGMPQADAQALLNACADAYGHALLYQTGTDPRNVPAGYVYGASQKLVIGARQR
jgi:hypothetical protein